MLSARYCVTVATLASSSLSGSGPTSQKPERITWSCAFISPVVSMSNAANFIPPKYMSKMRDEYSSSCVFLMIFSMAVFYHRMGLGNQPIECLAEGVLILSAYSEGRGLAGRHGAGP